MLIVCMSAKHVYWNHRIETLFDKQKCIIESQFEMKFFKYLLELFAFL